MKNMMSVLVNRSSELGLNFISSLVLPQFTTMTRDINEILVDGLNVEMIDDFADTEDNTLRLISFKYEPKEFTDYHSMISQLLEDSLRSGVFYVDGDRFTILATKFTKYLLRYPGYVHFFTSIGIGPPLTTDAFWILVLREQQLEQLGNTFHGAYRDHLHRRSLRHC